MESTTDERVLFPEHAGVADGVVIINARCRLQQRDGYRVVIVGGMPLAHFAAGDRASEAYAMVRLVDLGWAQQREVALAFGCDVRTVRRNQRRFEDGGLSALGRPPGFPRGRSRVAQSRQDAVNAWKAEGLSNREIGRRLGIDEKAVRKLAGRLGWKQRPVEQMKMPFESADSNLSACGEQQIAAAPVAAQTAQDSESEAGRASADPNLSAPAVDQGQAHFSLDLDPADRSGDPFRPVPLSAFVQIKETIHGRKLEYLLADQRIYLEYGRKKKRQRVFLRQVTCLSDDGHQTPIITSRRDLSTIEVAYRMFDRWRQENFFKYLREEFALDALVDYDTEPADATRDVPNPERSKINAELRKANAQLEQLQAHLGYAAFENREDQRRTMRGFKIANAAISARVRTALRRITELEKQRATIPARVPVQEVVEADVIKLAVERKHLTDILKMVAYQAEGDLLRLLSPHYRRTDQEGRTLIQSALSAVGDLEVTDSELLVSIEPLSSPHKTAAIATVCEQLDKTATRFPGTKLRMRFAVKSEPPRSRAFPGPRNTPNEAQPDFFEEG